MSNKTSQGQPIVVVEDDESMRHAIERILKAGGHEVVAFESAEEMLNANVSGDAACFVFDIQLQGMSGFDLLAHLVQHHAMRPVIFVTAYDEPAARAKAEELGAAAFLTKPFAGRDLLAAVIRGLSTKSHPTVEGQ